MDSKFLVGDEKYKLEWHHYFKNGFTVYSENNNIKLDKSGQSVIFFQTPDYFSFSHSGKGRFVIHEDDIEGTEISQKGNQEANSNKDKEKGFNFSNKSNKENESNEVLDNDKTYTNVNVNVDGNSTQEAQEEIRSEEDRLDSPKKKDEKSIHNLPSLHVSRNISFEITNQTIQQQSNRENRDKISESDSDQTDNPSTDTPGHKYDDSIIVNNVLKCTSTLIYIKPNSTTQFEKNKMICPSDNKKLFKNLKINNLKVETKYSDIHKNKNLNLKIILNANNVNKNHKIATKGGDVFNNNVNSKFENFMEVIKEEDKSDQNNSGFFHKSKSTGSFKMKNNGNTLYNKKDNSQKMKLNSLSPSTLINADQKINNSKNTSVGINKEIFKEKSPIQNKFSKSSGNFKLLNQNPIESKTAFTLNRQKSENTYNLNQRSKYQPIPLNKSLSSNFTYSYLNHSSSLQTFKTPQQIPLNLANNIKSIKNFIKKPKILK